MKATPAIALDVPQMMRSQWAAHGKEVGEMNRSQLENGVREAWEDVTRFKKIYTTSARIAKEIASGEYVQSEGFKPEVHTPSPRRAPRP